MAGTTHSLIPAYGTLAGTALTGAYQTLFTLSYDADIIQVFNSCDQAIILSGDGGTTAQWLLPPNRSFVLDFRSNVQKFPKNVFQAKHNGVAPTTGFISVTVIYPVT